MPKIHLCQSKQQCSREIALIGISGRSKIMAPNNVVAVEMIYWKDLKPLFASPSPCITITLPAFHHGAQSLPFATRLKAAVRAAQEELLQQISHEKTEGLMAPIRELMDDPEMLTGGRDMVIFRSPQLFSRFWLPGPVCVRTVVARYFHILPFLHQLCAAREFYILGLNQKNLRLLHYADGTCKEALLPVGLPSSVEEAGSFDIPDHTLRNHSPAGKSNGTMSGVSFGTGAEQEKSHERLHYFFRRVDQGLWPFLKGQPLLLSGASYEIATYRRAATKTHLLEGAIERDLHTLSIQEIARLACESARTQYRRKAEKELQQVRDTASLERTSTEVRRIVKAAQEGRVAKLILAEEAEFGATLAALESDSQEDLFNAAAVLSIRDGAEVFVLPSEILGAEAPIVAVFRY
jgi:hypothetical protein